MSGMTLPATTSRFGVTELLAATGGELRARPAAGSEAVGVSTDSRTLARGELFVALSGPREQPVRIVLDGHRFIGAALRSGAWGVLVEELALQREEVVRELAAWPGRAVIVVPDSLRALGDLAAYHRRRMPARIVGITGSNGKTTTKEMAFAIAAERWRVLRNEGNLNNLIGLPLTLLGLELGTKSPSWSWG
jgi:UDP-N-acetylmuramoyl-tripeptide--D-alanyl-D-alanine ligase